MAEAHDATVPGSVEAVSSFDIDTALNKNGFMEFLTKSTETIDMGNSEDLKNRFEAFNAKESMKTSLRNLYGEQIKKELEIDLDASDMNALDISLERLAIDKPEQLLLIKQRIDIFNELPKQTKELETQLGTLSNEADLSLKLDAMREDAGNLSSAKRYMGFFGKAKFAFDYLSVGVRAMPILFRVPGVSDIYKQRVAFENQAVDEGWEAVGEVKKKHGKIDSKVAGNKIDEINKQVKSVEDLIALLKDIGQKKSESIKAFDIIRKELLTGVSGIAEITAAVQKSAKRQLAVMMIDGASMKRLDEAQEVFEKFQALSNGESETGINFLEGSDLAQYQERIDALIEVAVTTEIFDAIQKSSVGEDSLAKLESALEKFVTKEKMGSKEKDDARKFVMETIEIAASSGRGTSTEALVKRLMCSRILIKMKNNI